MLLRRLAWWKTDNIVFAKTRLDGNDVLVHVRVGAWGTRMITFTEPLDDFPSDHLIAQLMLVL